MGNISTLSESFNTKKLCKQSFMERMSVLLAKQQIRVSVSPFFGGLGVMYVIHL